jgi:hypothetical protein
MIKENRVDFCSEMGRRALIVLLGTLVAMAAMLSVGCGGGDGSGDASGAANNGQSGSTSVSPEQAAFIEEAGKACNRERQGLTEEMGVYLQKREASGTPDSVATADMFRVVLIPAVEAEMAAIEKLTIPAGDEQQIEAILAGERKAIAELKRLQRASSLGLFFDRFKPTDQELLAYGLASCTKGPS